MFIFKLEKKRNDKTLACLRKRKLLCPNLREGQRKSGGGRLDWWVEGGGLGSIGHGEEFGLYSNNKGKSLEGFKQRSDLIRC